MTVSYWLLLAHAYMSGVAEEIPGLKAMYRDNPWAAANFLRVVQETLNERTPRERRVELTRALLALKELGVVEPIASGVGATLELLAEPAT
jgi:hypothetical protein